jgi:hypothetical protein
MPVVLVNIREGSGAPRTNPPVITQWSETAANGPVDDRLPASHRHTHWILYGAPYCRCIYSYTLSRPSIKDRNVSSIYSPNRCQPNAGSSRYISFLCRWAEKFYGSINAMGKWLLLPLYIYNLRRHQWRRMIPAAYAKESTRFHSLALGLVLIHNVNLLV